MEIRAIVYEQKLQELASIPPEQVCCPEVPMDTYIQQAQMLYRRAKADKPSLLQAGLSEELLEDLPFRCDAASEAHSIWNNFAAIIPPLATHPQIQAEQNADLSTALELRDELLLAVRYAYRYESDILAQVCEWEYRRDWDGVLDDLRILANIGRSNSAPLRKAGFDLAKLEQAAILSQREHRMVPPSSFGSDMPQMVTQIRNRAYTHLKEAVDAVVAYGQFLFGTDKTRSQSYAAITNPYTEIGDDNGESETAQVAS